MAQTFYIESDEEIISVISHLRKSLEEENIFVFPKRALVLQSIINLRLLEREAEKFKKKITIVSQDEIGRMLAEKAGIETREYQEDFTEKESRLEFSLDQSPQVIISEPIPSSPPEKSSSLLSSNAIGSSSFNMNDTRDDSKEDVAPSFAAPLSFGSLSPSRSGEKISFPIRNASPEKLTYLNSKRSEISAPVNSVIRGASMNGAQPSPVMPLQTTTSPIVKKMNENLTRISEQKSNERLKNFYTNADKNVQPSVREEKKLASSSATVNGKAHFLFFALGGVSLLSLVVVSLFFFLPKAEIHITPYKISQTVDEEFNSKTGDSSDSDVIPIRIIEREKEVSVSVPTTGKSGGTDQKSHGTVTLFNNFSTEPQSLVATTRLETSDGKIFRLVSGVVVPGMTTVNGKQEAGSIEAEVIADQAGEEYNIGAKAGFSIPGFKGSAKYDKFSAQSTKEMIGGGKSGVSDVFVITKLDQDTALREATAKAKTEFLNEIRGEIDSAEKILEEQIEITTETPAELPSIGMVANTIDYKGTFKIKALIFSEKMVKEKMENMSEKSIQSISFRSTSSSITYDNSSVDFATGTARIKARALIDMESVVDIEKLRTMLAGKDMKSIEASLGDFPELKSIRINFYPEWFVERVPKVEERVSIVIDPGEVQ